jgi:hypothetical protein
VSPTFSDDGLVLASSTQFGEGHLISTNYGETFSETHAGMRRTLVTGHTFSPGFRKDGVVYAVTNSGYYRSSDRGKTWKKQQLSPNSPVLSICTASDFVSSNEIYVLTKNALHKVSGTSPFAGGSTEEPMASAKNRNSVPLHLLA